VSEQGHGGLAVSKALKALGVDHLFTLTGGHIFPILDGCHQDGIRIVDTRHEQSAAFTAEGWARLTRSLGVCAVTAGPGVANAMSPLAQARFNGAPVLALGGRAPAFRWGQGSLQEIDHVPFVDPIAPSKTVSDTARVAAEVLDAARAALAPPRGPRFLDFPLDVLFNSVDFEVPATREGEAPRADDDGVRAVADLLAGAERPVVIAGANVWLDKAEDALLGFAETAEIPVFMNGQGRGCVPADHRLAFSRARSAAMKEADVVIVAGTPLDFRLGFGQSFAPDAKVVHLDSHPDLIASHVHLAASIGARLDDTFGSLTRAIETPADSKPWVERLTGVEEEKRDQVQAELRSDARPIHPMRIYGELVPLLDRDAVVIGDGGDFVSYAGREIPSFAGGCWLDPGPFGCLGVGPGYAIAARLAHPDRQIVLLLGDGALGFSGMELESLVRHKLPVVCIVGNNGIWGLEKHPMRGLYGYDVAAELRPGIRYERMMESFGGRGELVEDPDDIAPALKGAFDSGEPTLINVLTDPDIAYPRSANLA
jgi:acetolactate synthase I/II/III large subunit